MIDESKNSFGQSEIQSWLNVTAVASRGFAFAPVRGSFDSFLFISTARAWLAQQ